MTVNWRRFGCWLRLGHRPLRIIGYHTLKLLSVRTLLDGLKGDPR